MTLLLAIIVASFADVPERQEGVIRTRWVEVEDENGRVQIDITAEENEPDILLYDSDGDGIVVLNKDQDTTGLEVYNREGKMRLKISARYIVIFGDDARERLRLTKEGFRCMMKRVNWFSFWVVTWGFSGEDGKLKLRLRAK